ncbi:uncharacterized protein N7484_008216 [Penicillium longicatenatum]|uniref:uncharacterized protein n=1 Tax=Penicillium longicatenatum TaxID=1561947 RepID=UPI0025499945|nr:uncharacterized protein N7484_008216 [Penicillium longicatenatum]KAJ5640354.1 hypothetical protein N7484_008216 [Penicillium longicatenatum]
MEPNKRATRFNILKAQAPSLVQTKFPEDTDDGAQSSFKRLELPEAQQSRPRKIVKTRSEMITESGALGPVLQNGSPWDIYKVIFTCELAGKVSICENHRQNSQLVALRTTTRLEGVELLKKYVRLNHINILSAMEYFKEDTSLHFVVEDLPVTLEHLVASDAYPTEAQLASILKQVKIIDGLSHLIDHGYQHPGLKCSTSLISLDGVVKIGMTFDF